MLTEQMTEVENVLETLINHYDSNEAEMLILRREIEDKMESNYDCLDDGISSIQHNIDEVEGIANDAHSMAGENENSISDIKADIESNEASIKDLESNMADGILLGEN